MLRYKILIHDRNYSSFAFVDDDTNDDIIPNEENQLMNINPIYHNLFTKDVFTYDNGIFELAFSHIRTGIPIAGILMLENNKTFGRTINKKRLLYKCIPDDKHLPAFLVPYEIPIHFSKVYSNKYVLFKFDNWTDKHPHGILLETLGDVGILDIFYEYQLHCKSLHISLTDFTKKTREQLQKKTQAEYIDQILKNDNFQIDDRRYIHNIFTIDPIGSTDFDDAFSIEQIKQINQIKNIEQNNKYKISIYIANVYFWLETLALWKSFSSRVSTIYLPDRKRPMLPTVLSDNLCSLQQGNHRFAFVMDVIIDDNGHIYSIEYKNAIIKVNKNYYYEDPDLIYKNKDYSLLLSITNKLDPSIIDSHDVISYWMVKMNIECGNYMEQNNIGIFRLANYIHSIDPLFQKDISHLNETTQRVIKNWSNTNGQYVIYNNEQILEHEFMKTKNYVHITSPIRRLVDLINQIWMTKHLNMIRNISNDADIFMKDWLYKLDYVNASMRSIRKIQTDCQILYMCNKDNIIDSVYDGIIFDKLKKNDGAIVYMVYLEELKLLNRMKTYIDFDNYSKHKFKIFVFEDEYKIKKKIRIQMV